MEKVSPLTTEVDGLFWYGNSRQSADGGDPNASVSRTRWIAVEGVSWDVIKPLAIAYRFDSLALEQVLNVDQSHRKLTKVSQRKCRKQGKKA